MTEEYQWVKKESGVYHLEMGPFSASFYDGDGTLLLSHKELSIAHAVNKVMRRRYEVKIKTRGLNRGEILKALSTIRSSPGLPSRVETRLKLDNLLDVVEGEILKGGKGTRLIQFILHPLPSLTNAVRKAFS